MTNTKKVPSDKVYRLIIGSPLSYTLASRNHPRYPLMWYDEDTNTNRALRYASNQKSPFEDAQDGNAIIEPIVFEDGMLSVPKKNPVLQEFLSYHPLNGVVFVEVDKEKEAHIEVEDLNIEVDALIEARNLSLDQVEMLTRVMFGKDPSVISTAELKRDMLVFAKQDPRGFLAILNDPELRHQDKIRMFFERNLLAVRNNGKDIYFNTPTNKKKMCSVPFGEDVYHIADHFLRSDEGIDALKMLDVLLES
jgi:hypothetical protein